MLRVYLNIFLFVFLFFPLDSFSISIHLEKSSVRVGEAFSVCVTEVPSENMAKEGVVKEFKDQLDHDSFILVETKTQESQVCFILKAIKPGREYFFLSGDLGEGLSPWLEIKPALSGTLSHDFSWIKLPYEKLKDENEKQAIDQEIQEDSVLREDLKHLFYFLVGIFASLVIYFSYRYWNKRRKKIDKSNLTLEEVLFKLSQQIRSGKISGEVAMTFLGDWTREFLAREYGVLCLHQTFEEYSLALREFNGLDLAQKTWIFSILSKVEGVKFAKTPVKKEELEAFLEKLESWLEQRSAIKEDKDSE